MDLRAEVREFLTTRRARLRPEDVGLDTTGVRRVPGLRRSEVAALADVSVEYYARLERGSLRGVSESVLGSLSRALQLSDAEHTHLYRLAGRANGSTAGRLSRGRAPALWQPRTSLVWMLDNISAVPAFITNGRQDVLATNALAAAFYAEVLSDPRQPANFARFTYLDEASKSFYPDWDRFADTSVQILRAEAGRNPHDKTLHDLIGELSTRSEVFRAKWSAQNVRDHGTGTKVFHHPVVGEMTLAYDTFDLVTDPGLTLTLYNPEPGSASQERLELLASWHATTRASQGTVAAPPSPPADAGST